MEKRFLFCLLLLLSYFSLFFTFSLTWCPSGVNLMLDLGFILWLAQGQEATVILDFPTD